MNEPETIGRARSAAVNPRAEREVVAALLLIVGLAGAWWLHLLLRQDEAPARRAARFAAILPIDTTHEERQHRTLSRPLAFVSASVPVDPASARDVPVNPMTTGPDAGAESDEPRLNLGDGGRLEEPPVPLETSAPTAFH